MSTLKNTLVVMATAAGLGLAHAQEINLGSVAFPSSLEADQGKTLSLNGAGIRKRLVFDVYAIALYLPQRVSQAEEALSAPPPKVVLLEMLRDVSGKDFADALISNLKNNASSQELSQYASAIEQLQQALASQPQNPKGTRVELVESLDGTVAVRRNGQDMLQPIPAPGFFRLLLSIWLGPKPVQDSLKAVLLNGPKT